MPSFLRAACYATALVAMATALPDGNGDGMRNPIDILPTWSGVSLRCTVLQHLRTRLNWSVRRGTESFALPPRGPVLARDYTFCESAAVASGNEEPEENTNGYHSVVVCQIPDG